VPFNGSYSLRFQGTSANGSPAAGVGIVVSDGAGSVSGSLTDNSNGTVCRFTLSGSYTENPDSTGYVDAKATPVSGPCLESAPVQTTIRFNLGSGQAWVNTSAGVSSGHLTRQ
jgi:hypothetical protein